VIKRINKRLKNEKEDSFGESEENLQNLNLINPDTTSTVTFGVKSSKISQIKDNFQEERVKLNSLFFQKEINGNSDSANNLISSTNFPSILDLGKQKEKLQKSDSSNMLQGEQVSSN
jgi:hypothetical protein